MWLGGSGNNRVVYRNANRHAFYAVAGGKAMKAIRIYGREDRDFPETWAECEKLLAVMTDGFYDQRGRNTTRRSACCDVAFAMFGEQFMAADPTMAMLYLMQKIAKLKGAGL